MYTKEAGLPLPWEGTNCNVRVLDIINCEGKPAPPIFCAFPNLRCVRDFSCCDPVVEHFCAAQTDNDAFTLVHFVPGLDALHSDVATLRARRIICAFPHHGSIASLFTVPAEAMLGAHEVVWAFMPELDDQSTPTFDHATLLELPRPIDYILHDSSLRELHKLLRDTAPAFRLTIAAPGLNPALGHWVRPMLPHVRGTPSWCDVVKARLLHDVETSSGEAKMMEVIRKIRVVPLDEWQQEITEEEWELLRP